MGRGKLTRSCARCGLWAFSRIGWFNDLIHGCITHFAAWFLETHVYEHNKNYQATRSTGREEQQHRPPARGPTR